MGRARRAGQGTGSGPEGREVAGAAREVPRTGLVGGLQIERVLLESLHLDPANARLHPDSNLDAITASLKRFGQAEPLVVLAKSGRVIGGNGRLAAMRKLGWQECDVVRLELDELQATALAIALNRTAELAEWDAPVLARLLEELRSEDALEGVGYSPSQIDDLLEELGTPTSPGAVDDPGPSEVPASPVSRRGEVWLLGDHRLLCGDCTRRRLATHRGRVTAAVTK